MKSDIKKTEFRPSHIKLVKDGGLKVSYVEKYEDEEGRPQQRDIDVTETPLPHPDLVAAAEALKHEALMATGHLAIMDKLDEDYGAKIPKQARQRMTTNLIEKCTVHTFNFSGKDRTAGVVISGSLTTINGTTLNFNTPLINLDKVSENLLPEIKDKLFTLESEVYEYLMEGKVGNPTLEVVKKDAA